MSSQSQLLIVDDDTAMREMLSSLFRDRGYAVEEGRVRRRGLERAGEQCFDVVLSDIRMAGKTGIEMVGELRDRLPETPVVLMTAFGSIDSAVESMRAGAFDYITKPFEPDTVVLTIERALERRALEEENRRLRRALDQTSSFGDLIGESTAMREIFALIRKVGHSSSSVLISGESGTGKEVVARTIHYSGNRAERTLRSDQLHGDSGGTAGERTIRTRARRVYRSAHHEARTLREGKRWNTISRRDRRHESGTPG